MWHAPGLDYKTNTFLIHGLAGFANILCCCLFVCYVLVVGYIFIYKVSAACFTHCTSTPRPPIPLSYSTARVYGNLHSRVRAASQFCHLRVFFLEYSYVMVELIINEYSRVTSRNKSNFDAQLASRGYHTRGRYCTHDSPPKNEVAGDKFIVGANRVLKWVLHFCSHLEFNVMSIFITAEVEISIIQ